MEEKQNSDHSGWLEVGCMKSGKDDPEKTQLLHTIEQHHSVALTLRLTQHSDPNSKKIIQKIRFCLKICHGLQFIHHRLLNSTSSEKYIFFYCHQISKFGAVLPC